MKAPMKKIFITVLLFFFFFFFFGQMLAQDKVKAAETAIKKKDYATAMQIAKEFLELDSANTALRILINVESNNIVSKELFEMIGDSYSKQKVVENALLYYDKAEALDSLDKNIKFKTAELLYKEKRYTDAVNKYLIIVSMDSTDTKALYNTANIFYLAKMYPDAALFFDKYLIYEQLNGSYLKAAKSNLESKNYQKAYNYANLASEKDKSEKEVVKIMAVAAAWLGKYDESLSYYAKIEDSTLSKNDIRDLVNAGRNCEASKKDSLALIYYEKALSIDSTYVDSTYKEVNWNVAILNYKLANYDIAIDFFNKFLVGKPNFEPAIRFKAFAYLQKKDYNKTREFLLEAIALNDTLVDSYFWLAQSYKAVDSLGRSAEVMEKMITIIEGKENLYRDKLLDAYGFLGQTAYEKKNYGKAIPYFIKALSYKSDNLPFTLMLANCYSILKDTENAKKYYYKVLSLASDRSQEYENAYKSLRAMGELPAKPPRK
jgi:tetratricopeptide (TPR) repeat protein